MKNSGRHKLSLCVGSHQSVLLVNDVVHEMSLLIARDDQRIVALAPERPQISTG